MTYGLGRDLPKATDSPGKAAADWRSLDSRSRLRLVEQVLRPGESLDGFPLAL